ncbi:GTPase-activating protein-like [Carpediemonas membranifera]|uniref:GTPase-activating protein-like n=1 Tax=Carpediemonas membranifera TaxID=201153 RepID=A0A8J6DXV6_9EUKA|nr:GTPase-activating protein-like [Carpediemonas membranifera]|eukprot:KAG9391074.1 GTPase-activating protein-like [Carpediemonas membranifera]
MVYCTASGRPCRPLAGRGVYLAARCAAWVGTGPHKMRLPAIAVRGSADASKILKMRQMPSTPTSTRRGSSAGLPPTPAQSSNHSRVRTMFAAADTTQIELISLANCCWSGAPPEFRASSWRRLCGIESENPALLTTNRAAYRKLVDKLGPADGVASDQPTWHQIADLDLPRNAPDLPGMQTPPVRALVSRLLYIWAARHPACGYVQGIMDVVTPLVAVFAGHRGYDMTTGKDDGITEDQWLDVEADCFYTFQAILAAFQDAYTASQPGIHRMLRQLGSALSHVCPEVKQHMDEVGADLLHVCFRWMNCLLLRELPLALDIRLLDTYLSELAETGHSTLGTQAGLPLYHVFVCAALLAQFSAGILEADFQQTVHLLQHVRTLTDSWGDEELAEVLAQAHLWRNQYWSPGRLSD